jgi:hypothetical protein
LFAWELSYSAVFAGGASSEGAAELTQGMTT